MKFRAGYKAGTVLLNGREYAVENHWLEAPEEFRDQLYRLGYKAKGEILAKNKGLVLLPELTVRKAGKINLAICMPHMVGGSETRILQMVQHFNHYNVYIYYIKEDVNGDLLNRYKACKNVISCACINREASLRKAFIKNNIDLVFFYGTTLPVIAMKGRPRPLFVLSINTDSYENAIRFAEVCNENVDEIVTVSPHIEKMLKKKVHSIKSIISGADPKRFYPRTEPKKDNIIRIGYLSRLIRHKGSEFIPLALAGIKNVEFWIAASEREGEMLRNVIAGCKRHNVKYKFFGFVSDPERLLRQIDMLVLMSNQEGLPMITIEAALCGTLIISTPVAGLPYVFRQGENIIFCKRNTRSLRNAIIKAIENPVWALQISRNARKFAENNLTVQRMAKDYETVFDGLIKKARKSTPVISLCRNGGGGDIIMSEPAVRKLKTMYPNARIVYECGDEFKHVVRALGWKRGFFTKNTDIAIKFYYDIPAPPHAIEQYMSQVGGRFSNEEDNLPRINISTKKQFEIGVHTTADCPEKCWNMERWAKLCEKLKIGGYDVYQIDNNKQTINNVKRKLSTNLGELIKLIPQFRLIITIDTITSHIAMATRTRAIVLWGGASSPELTGYKQQINIRSPMKCHCWKSVKQIVYKRADCPGGCIDAIQPEMVYRAVLKELPK